MSDYMSVEQVLAQMRAMATQSKGGVEPAQEAAGQVSFGDMLRESIDQVNATQQTAQKKTTQFELGEGNANLAEVMVDLQKSNLSFQAMVQVRNKLVDAYKDVMNMPI
jgi:flagellar hook-basal body complex protein FliE